MGPKALQRAQSRAILPNFGAGFWRHLLIRDRLEELSNPQSARIPRRPLGWQRVIGADHLVSKRHVGLRTEEKRSVIFQALEEESRILRQHFDVLARDPIGHRRGLLLVVHENDLAVIAPRDTRDTGRPERRELTLNFLHRRVGEAT